MRWTLLLILLALTPPAAAAEARSALFLVRLRDAVVAFVGSCADGASLQAVPGCASGEPSWELALTRGGDGSWSLPRRLGASARGVPFANHDALWTLATERAGENTVPRFLLAPLATELGQVTLRADRHGDGTRHAAAGLDAWTLLVVEALPDPYGVRASRLTAEGVVVREVTATETDLGLPWPADAVLGGADGDATTALAWARDAAGAAHAVTHAIDGTAAVLPALPAEPDRGVALTWDGRRALAVRASDRALEVLASGADGWASVAELGAPPPSRAPLVALAAGAERRDLVAAWIDGGALHVASWREGEPVARAVVPLGDVQDDAATRAASRPLPPAPEDDGDLPPLAMVGLAFMAALALAAAFVWIRYVR